MADDPPDAGATRVPSTSPSERPGLDRIGPGDPMASYLFLKVIGDPSIIGSPMPLGGGALSAELIGLLQSWIERGAPND